MPTAEEFIEWVLSPERTEDERFAAEQALMWCRDRDEDGQRSLQNSAWWLKAAQDLNEGRSCTIGLNDEIATRDLKWIQFFPHLETLELENCAVDDYSPLATLRGLRSLNVKDGHTTDLRPIGECRQITMLWFFGEQARVNVDGWERLTKLKSFWWTAGMKNLEGIKSWPAMNDASFGSKKWPVRDLFQLPAMPRLRELYLPGVHSLEGLERYPRLVRLEIEGPVQDVTPLMACRELKQVRIELPEGSPVNLKGMAALTRLPHLRYVEVKSEDPVE